MLNTLLAKVIGTQNERELKRIRPQVARINELEPGIKPLSDADLKLRTTTLRERAANGEPLDDLLPEAFAVVREAGRRVLNMRHFDVLRNLLGTLETGLASVKTRIETQQALGRATPSTWPIVGWLTSAFGTRTDPF